MQAYINDKASRIFREGLRSKGKDVTIKDLLKSKTGHNRCFLGGSGI